MKPGSKLILLGTATIATLLALASMFVAPMPRVVAQEWTVVAIDPNNNSYSYAEHGPGEPIPGYIDTRTGLWFAGPTPSSVQPPRNDGLQVQQPQPQASSSGGGGLSKLCSSVFVLPGGLIAGALALAKKRLRR